MKLTLLSLLPGVSALAFWTNDGWSKPADFVTRECASDPSVNYFCGTLSGTRGENIYPDAFKNKRECNFADGLGRGCVWNGASGSVVCCK